MKVEGLVRVRQLGERPAEVRDVDGLVRVAPTLHTCGHGVEEALGAEPHGGVGPGSLTQVVGVEVVQRRDLGGIVIIIDVNILLVLVLVLLLIISMIIIITRPASVQPPRRAGGSGFPGSQRPTGSCRAPAGFT